VATRLCTGLTADCTELAIDPDTRLLRQTRPAFGGNIMATIICPHRRPQMATVRHHVFEMPGMDAGRQGQIVRERAVMGEDEIASKVVDFVTQEGEVNLADAQVIVAGGLGVGGPEGFDPICELAEMLGWGGGLLHAPSLMLAGFPTSIRSARPAAPCGPTSTLPAASQGPFSI